MTRYSAATRDRLVLTACLLWGMAMIITTVAACALGHGR